MKNPIRTVFIVLLGALAISDAAFAYVGPGAGLTLLGALWGLLAAIGAALVFVISWPLRRWRKRVRAERSGAIAGQDSE